MDKTDIATASERPMTRVIREPTLHFLLVAVLVFAAHGMSRDGKVLEIDGREIEARLFLQELNNGQELSDAQRQAIRTAYIEEQILVQEALALELDNDARIHDMLAQKMRHVLSGDVIQPDRGDLQAWYAERQARYRSPEQLDLEELVFDSQDALPAEVSAGLQQGMATDELLRLSAGIAAPLPAVSQRDLSSIFSPDFASRVFAAAADSWQGPFLSNRGQHWLRIIERQPARQPEFDEIADRIRLDWIFEQEEALLQREIDRLRQEYRVVILQEDEH